MRVDARLELAGTGPGPAAPPPAREHNALSLSPSSGYAATQHQIRSRGALDIAFQSQNGPTRLARSFQSGCLRLRVPRAESASEIPTAVVINTAGGIAGGDALNQSFRWDEGAHAIVTTQAAEKVYRALAGGPAARIDTTLHVRAGAHAEWLPQEAILFDSSVLRREARVLLDAQATFLGMEALILGREAMGETVRAGHLSDRLRIWRDGRLVYADALVLDGEIDGLMRRASIGHGMRAMAIIVHAAPDAPALLPAVRAALAEPSGCAAASAWNGLLAVRLLAPDGEALRRDIASAFAVLREGRPLPRVWRC